MSVIAIGSDRPQYISGIYTRPYVVKNSSNATVYLGQDSSLTIGTRAFSVPPGSSLNWSGDTELWGITDAGQEGEIEILFTGDTAFTPGGTVNASNNPIELERVIFTPAAVLTNQVVANFVLGDIAQYASLGVAINIGFTGAPPALDITNYLQLIVGQYQSTDLSNHGYTVQHIAEWLLDSTNATVVPPSAKPVFTNMKFQVPVELPVASISLFLKLGAIPAKMPNSIEITVVGSGQQINEPLYINDSVQSNGTIPLDGFDAFDSPVPGSVSHFLASKNGDTKIFLRKQGAGAAGRTFVVAYQSGVAYSIVGDRVDAGDPVGLTKRIDFLAPARPIEVTTVNEIAGNLQTTIVQ